MALCIYQVTYSDRKFCRFVVQALLVWALRDKLGDEIWQAYQGSDQIKLEIVVSPIRPSGGGVGAVYSEN